MGLPQCEYIDEYASRPPLDSPLKFDQSRFLDVSVHSMTMQDLHDAIGQEIFQNRKTLIANHNMHSLYLWHKERSEQADGSLQRFYRRAKWTVIDGMPLVGLARLHGFPVKREHRIAYNYSLRYLFQLARLEGWRIYYLGSSEFVSTRGGIVLRDEFPGLQLRTRHGYFSKEKDGPESEAVLKDIASFRPHILLVGMGMPIQETWIEENFDALRSNVIMNSGATLDYMAGTLPLPPEWVGQIGFEWLYRLINEPSRLGARYLAEPWSILGSVVRARLARSRSSTLRPQPFSPKKPASAILEHLRKSPTA